jgi:hypothetical protein
MNGAHGHLPPEYRPLDTYVSIIKNNATYVNTPIREKAGRVIFLLTNVTA